MDQKFVSGLGNIYVNEVLFMSQINPKKILKSANSKEFKKIIKFVKKILVKSINEGGSSIKDFSNSDGVNRKLQQKFNVYGREGQRCSKQNCAGNITKIFISNRSTFYCAKCQK